MRTRSPASAAARPSAPVSGRPLAGRRIVLTRPVSQSGGFEVLVRSLGGEPMIAPAIAITPPESWALADSVLRHVDDYDWVTFTSANAARALVARADEIGVDRERLRTRRLAVVGPATGAAVASLLRAPDATARERAAGPLAAELPVAAGTCVLFPRGDLAGDALPVGLRRRGAIVDNVVVYRTIPGSGLPEIAECVRAGNADALLFASASAVRAVADVVALPTTPTGATKERRRVVVFCIGPATAEAAREAGMEPVAVADTATQDDLIARVAAWFAAGGDEGR